MLQFTDLNKYYIQIYSMYYSCEQNYTLDRLTRINLINDIIVKYASILIINKIEFGI